MKPTFDEKNKGSIVKDGLKDTHSELKSKTVMKRYRD